MSAADVLDYFLRGVVLTLWQLLLVLGPPLLLAVVLHFVSRFVRNRAAGAFGVDAYTYFTAPGVAVHELGHALFCVIFRHRIVSMRLFRPDADGSLGRVDHAYNPRSPYQKAGNFFIGTGPIWLGTALVYLLSLAVAGPAPVTGTEAADVAAPSSGAAVATTTHLVADEAWRLAERLLQPSVMATWQFWLFAYLVFCVGSHITLSRSDVKGASRGFVWVVGLMLAFNWGTLWVGEDRVAGVVGAGLLRWGVVVYAAGAFVVGLNLILAAAVLVASWVVGVVRR